MQLPLVHKLARQPRHGTAVDRLAGPLAWAVLCAAMAWPLAAAADAPPAAARHFGEQLRSGGGARYDGRGSAAIAAGQPWKPAQSSADDGGIPEVEMFVGESRVFPAPGVARIAVGNGAILTAAALDEKEVILFANALGTSSLFIWNSDGRYQRLKVNVVPGDTSRVAREIAAFLESMPQARSSIIGPNIVVEGEGLSNEELQRIEMLAQRYPQIINFTSTLGVEKMIMLDVKVVEFPTAFLRELGLSWRGTGGVAVGGVWSPVRRSRGGPFEILLQTGGTGTLPPFIGVGGGALAPPSGLNIGSVLNMGLNATLNLLQQEGKAITLAEPQLSARNGARASFLAGGEIPYAVRDIEGPKIEFKPYGVKLDIAPRVDNSGNMHVGISTEVSDVDPSIITEFGPALRTRSTQTEFNVREGDTIVLSGLIQRNRSINVDKVPLLGDIPILGALFRSRSFQDEETELVIFVTPTVINARSPGMVDRIQRTQERLGQQLGPMPYLSWPLQPRADLSRPDLVPPPALQPEPAQRSRSDAEFSFPASGEQSLLAPRAPGAGGIALEPQARRGMAARLLAGQSQALARSYRLQARGLSMLQELASGAPVQGRVQPGQVVQGLAAPARGASTTVDPEGQPDRVTTAWLQPAQRGDARRP